LSIRHASEEGLSFPPGSKLERGSSISRPEFKIADVPDAPSAPSATDVGTGRALNNGAATVSFTPAPTGGAASSYTVTSSPGSFTGTGASSPVTVPGLASTTSYTFSVTATNSTGTSSSSGTSNSVTVTTVPGAPTIGVASAVNATTISLSFTPPAASGGKAISAYAAISSPSIPLSVSGTSSPVTVTGAFAAGQAYTFTLAAINANGTSSYSSSSNAVTTH